MANSINEDPKGSFDSDIKCLTISTLNVRGLRNNMKQNAILHQFKKLEFDIIAMQETHLLTGDIHQIESKWKGKCIFAEGTRNSKGLCFLFSKKLDKHEINIIYANDRILLCSLKLGNDKLLICNIYAPSNEKKTLKLFFC